MKLKIYLNMTLWAYEWKYIFFSFGDKNHIFEDLGPNYKTKLNVPVRVDLNI